MRYRRFYLGAGLLAVLFACNFQIPETVTVRAEPTIRIPLGTRENIMANTEGLDILTGLDALTDPESDQYIEGLSFRDVPAGDPVTLVLTRDLVDIAIDDFATDTLDLGQIEPTIEDISISVPEITFPDEDLVLDPVPADQIDIDPLSISNIPETPGTVSRTVTVNIQGCDSSTFSAGSLIIGLTALNKSAGFNARVNSASLNYGGASPVPASGTMPAYLDGQVRFDLTGITLLSSFSVTFNMEILAGDSSDFDLSLVPSFSSDTRISSASGITIDTTVDGTVDVPLTDAEDLDSAQIGSGNITVTLAFPAAWNIIDYSLTMTLQQDNGSGGWTTLDSVTQANTPTVLFDLAGLNIGAGDMRVQYTATVLSEDENAVFSTPATIGNVTGDINSFSIMRIIAEDIDFSETINEAIEDEDNDLVAAVTFTSPGLEITINNQLPIDLEVSVNSAALRVNDMHTFASISNTLWSVTLLPAGSDPVNVLSIPASLTAIDFSIDVTSPDYNSTSHVLTMTNVVPGDEYTMSGSASVDLDIESITIDSITEAYQFPDASAGDPGLDFSELGGILQNGMTISGITATLYTDLGALTDNSGSLGLRLSTDYDDDGTDDYLLGDAGSYVVLDGSSIAIDGMDDVINAFPGDLYFDFALEATGTTIPAGGTNQHISASLEVVLPLQFEVTDPEGVELLDENGDPVIPVPDEDILGRTTAEDADDMNEILDMAEEVSIYIDITNTLGMSLELEISAPDTGFTTKTISLESGEQTVTFSSDDINSMINTIPFLPEFRVFIPPGTHAINEGSEEDPADVSVSLWLEVQTALEYSTGGEE